MVLVFCWTVFAESQNIAEGYKFSCKYIGQQMHWSYISRSTALWQHSPWGATSDAWHDEPCHACIPGHEKVVSEKSSVSIELKTESQVLHWLPLFFFIRLSWVFPGYMFCEGITGKPGLALRNQTLSANRREKLEFGAHRVSRAEMRGGKYILSSSSWDIWSESKDGNFAAPLCADLLPGRTVLSLRVMNAALKKAVNK